MRAALLRAAVRAARLAGPEGDFQAWWSAASAEAASASGSAAFVGPLSARDYEAAPLLSLGAIGDLHSEGLGASTRRAEGAWYTPPEVVLAALGDLRAGESVLDPACGGGRFLLAAAERGARVVGWDRDPEAVELCRALLWIQGAEGEVHLLDALERYEKGDLPRFDRVLGNPPYRAGRLAALPERYRQSFAVAEYQLDPFPLFLELGLACLEPEGELAFVVPNSWLSNHRARRLRRHLLEAHALVEVVELPAETFAAGVETHIVRLREGRTPAEVPVRDLEGAETGRLLIQDPAAPIALVRDAPTRELLRRAQSWGPSLGEVCAVARGVNPYHHSRHSPQEIAQRVFHARTCEGPEWSPELRGQHLGPYRLWWSGEAWLRYGPWLKEPRKPELFEGPRLLVRKIIGETLYAACIEARFYCDQSIYIAQPREDCAWPLGALLALVNSRVLARWVRARYQEDDRLFPQLKLGELRALPLPPVDPVSAEVAALARDALSLQRLETQRLGLLDRDLPPGDRSRARQRVLRMGWPPPQDQPASRLCDEITALRAQIELAVERLYDVEGLL